MPRTIVRFAQFYQRLLIYPTFCLVSHGVSLTAARCCCCCCSFPESSRCENKTRLTTDRNAENGEKKVGRRNCISSLGIERQHQSGLTLPRSFTQTAPYPPHTYIFTHTYFRLQLYLFLSSSYTVHRSHSHRCALLLCIQ